MLLEFISLVYGQLIIRFVGPVLQNIFGCNRFTNPGMRIVHRHLVEPRPQFTDALAVLVDRLPRADAQRLLEHRVDERRAVQADAVLGGPGHRDVLVAAFGHRHRVVLLGTSRAVGRWRATAFCVRHISAPATNTTSARPSLNVHAGPVDQRLRHVAADAAVAGG